MLQPSLEGFEHNLPSMRDECNCPVVWTFFSTAPLGIWDKDWAFLVLWPLLGFPDFLTYLRASSFRILNSSAGIPYSPLALLAAVLPKAHWLHTPQCLAEWESAPSWLSGSLRSFWYGSSVYSFQFTLISSASTMSIPFLYLLCPSLGGTIPWCFQLSWRNL